MTDIGLVRHRASSLILWCVFLCFYVGGAGILLLGLIFTWQSWWIAFHQHPAMSFLVVKSGEVLLLGMGLLLALIIPLIQFRGLQKDTARQKDRRLQMEQNESIVS